MSEPRPTRRSILATGAACGTLAAVGDLGFLGGLPAVAAEDARVSPGIVRLRPEIEPLVRLLEETPRERAVEAVAAQIRQGTPYREVLAALQLAGVKNIKPRPVGFKFHAVLVVNSAHQASLASPDSDRWLPLLWAVDTFKSSQAQDVKEGDWTMSAVDEKALPAPDQARARFIAAMDAWDEDAADVAAAQLARTAGATEVFELLWRYGARDYRDIGHKAIYVSNAWRTLQVIGWEHAEPVVRSLAFALLQRGNVNPAQADEPADRPWRRNLERAAAVRPGWTGGTGDRGATMELVDTLRSASPVDAGAQVVTLLNKGVGADCVWDGVLLSAGELISRLPNILGIHCVTSANALHYAYRTSGRDDTRLMLLLQAASFMAMFREQMARDTHFSAAKLDALQPAEGMPSGPEGIEAVLGAVSRDRTDAARKCLAYLRGGGSPEALMTAARRLIFLKGTDSHDYKFSSAALEDYRHVAPGLRDLYLASAMFNLKGTGDRDNPLAARARAALG